MKFAYYLWSYTERIGANIVSLGGNIILSYLLSPADFGLIAMLGIFTSIVYSIIDCGLSDCLMMQRSVTNRDYNTVFFFNVFIGCIILISYWLLAPYIASFFNQPLLENIMKAFGFGAVINSLGISQATKMRINLQFRKITLITLASVTLALIFAIILAINGARYWALVEMQIGFQSFYLIGLIVSSKWNLNFEFDYVRFKEFWKFGINLLITTILTQISRNIFSFIIGKSFTVQQAAYVNQAQKLQETPTNALESSISNTSYILIAKEKSAEEQKDKIIKMFGIITFINSFFCILLLALSQPIILFVFADKWIPVIPYFRIILLMGLVAPICNFMMIIFKLADSTSTIRNIVIFEKSGIIILAAALSYFGIFSMLFGAIAVSLLAFTFYVRAASQLININQGTFYKIFIFNLLFATAAGIICYLSTLIIHNSLSALILGIIIYFAIMLIYLKHSQKAYYNYFILQIRKILLHIHN